ncbi:hypothetical protein Poli38472_007539 [Pythium oligandrum]|uniref:Uncharacterized protein n=1 Tax=Pythium oligandrum TaxID=41045 RepID=A0A8K1CQC6_PYTOL|nr:hypothetical protein Poli38472_007539 [Pythium oligandrum]|eukprot:TMW67867.1 hypothetical protein Poli38472_007539 [Pythium oligandrum]
MAPSIATVNDTTINAGSKVWLITGCSSGFGRELAIAARNRGDLVIATARKIEALKDLRDLGCEALTLDVTADDATVNGIAAKAHALYGRIDILVNNAGYSINGAVEEASSEETQAIFDTNLFGLLRVTRAVLPYMRQLKSGTIANIGSTAGYCGSYPACGLYSATKFAVAGITQTLRQEVADLGIEVTVIEPGYFKTNITSAGLYSKKSLPEYAHYSQMFKDIAENGAIVAADPAKGAKAIVEALTKSGRCVGRALPNRMPLGGDAFTVVQSVLTTGQKELDEWKDFTDATEFAFDQ